MVRPVEGSALATQAGSETAEGTVTVQRGETFAQVAQRNDVSENALMDANPRVDPSRVQAGQELTLPEKQQGPQPQSTEPQPSAKSSTSNSSPQLAEHSIAASAKAAYLNSQIPVGPLKERKLEGKISDRGSQTAETTTTAKPLDTTVQTAMTNAGLKNVSNPPSDTDLKTYYSTNGPAHDLISKGNFKDAASEYRKLAGAEKNPAEKSRLETVANQLDVAQTMNDAKIGGVSFPPSEANVTVYFKTLKGKPLPEIQDAFRGYANAFYVHSETKGVDRGDIVYDEHKHPQGKTMYRSNAPETWKEISDSREMRSDGRRVIDCEGYALMGQKIFNAAGFKNVTFGVASRADDPNTPDNESFTRQHIMVSGSRTVNVDGHPHTEVAVISNNHFTSKTSGPNPKASDFDQLQSESLVKGYNAAFRERNGIPGGLLVKGDQAWRTAFELEDAIKARQKK